MGIFDIFGGKPAKKRKSKKKSTSKKTWYASAKYKDQAPSKVWKNGKWHKTTIKKDKNGGWGIWA